MSRRYLLLISLTLLVLATGIYGGVQAFRVAGMPFDATFTDARTAVVSVHAGHPLPPGLKAGDEIDLPASDTADRIASIMTSLPLGNTYAVKVRQSGGDVTIPVRAVDFSQTAGGRFVAWSELFVCIISTGFALLLLWRGHDQAALGMAFWLIANMAGTVGQVVPADGWMGSFIFGAAGLCFLLARVGFYLMIDALVAAGQSVTAQRLYRGCFLLLLLAAGFLSLPGAQLIYAFTGWGGLLDQSQVGLVLTASYVLPMVMLAASYGAAERIQRQRLRWMLWCGLLWLLGIFVSDTQYLGFQASLTLAFSVQCVAILGFVYTVLRHRVVDVSVVIDRTLVYGGATALVVGVLAAVNALVQHAALGTGASLLLQVAVPLSLGIVLSRVRTWLDRLVEQVFFRKKYRADKSLRRFARHAAEYGQADEMLRAALHEIRERLGVPGVAVYEPRGEAYERVHQAGGPAYPERIKADDPAFVAIRADRKDLELSEYQSGLGTEGHLFPMTAFGGLHGVIVCANRPGERYASDERRLLAHLAHHLGVALHIIDARQSREFVRAVARGEIKPASVKTRARSLELDWAGS